MKAFSFYLALPFLYLLALLPMKWLYAVSGFLNLILFYLVGYRKKVIYQNLQRSFPTWTEKQLQEGVKIYYSYLCDLLLETFKLLTFSPEQLLKHCSFDQETLKLIQNQLDSNNKMTIVMGHYGNWEWACNAIKYQAKTRQMVVYKPMSNPYFEKLTNKMRSRTGSELVPMSNILRSMMAHKDSSFILSLAADQTPPPETAYWTTFLNQDTPFFNGVEKLSKKFDTSVVFLSVQRVARGKYVMKGQLITPSAKAVEEDHGIIRRFVSLLEADIKRDPYTWLWSHRRWKHSRKNT